VGANNESIFLPHANKQGQMSQLSCSGDYVEKQKVFPLLFVPLDTYIEVLSMSALHQELVLNTLHSYVSQWAQKHWQFTDLCAQHFLS
jgi:hypothetical protein